MSNSPICEIVFYPVFMLSEPQHLHWPEDFVGQISGCWEAGCRITLARLLLRVPSDKTYFPQIGSLAKVQAAR
jgi:hypothetical protein